MIPVAAAAVVSNPKFLKSAGLVIGGVILIGGAYYAYTQWSKKREAVKASNVYSNSSNEGLAVQYAGLMHSALNSGWFGLTEDEEAIYKTAQKIYKAGLKFGDVANAYRKLYNEELLTKINKHLSPDELEIFNKAINTGVYVKKGWW